MHVLNYIAIGIGIVGVGVIYWGVLVASFELVVLELKRRRGTCRMMLLAALRNQIGGLAVKTR